MKYRIVAFAIDLMYRIMCLLCKQRKNRIAMLSRQSADPFDFRLLDPYLRAELGTVDIRRCCVENRMTPAILLRQLYLCATSCIVLVDGYVPAVSVPKHQRAKVIQMWHALGAIKKFGYQALGTSEGRTREQADGLRMHRGYDAVIAGCDGAVGAFAEAFDIDADKILPIGLPRTDYIASPDFARMRQVYLDKIERRYGVSADDGYVNVLYAPTFRRHLEDDGGNILADAVTSLSYELQRLADAAGVKVRLILSAHPIQKDDGNLDVAPGTVLVHTVGTLHFLPLVDYVITDYSTIAFEAGLSDGTRVMFHMPDHDAYGCDPGLNIDPEAVCPSCCFDDVHDLARTIVDDAGGRHRYDDSEFMRFFDGYVGEASEGSAIVRIGETVRQWYRDEIK